MAARDSTTHLVHPRIPVWAANLAVLLLVVLMWPVYKTMDRYTDPYVARIVLLIGLNLILATSLNLVNGITGQFSLGHAGFMAVGAYVTGSLMKQMNPQGFAGEGIFLGLLITGGIAAAAAGLLVGIPVLRLRGDYLAIATLGFGEIINVVIINTEKIGPFDVGGASGLHGIPAFTNLFWSFAWAIASVVCIWRLAYSTKGLAFRAVREDEVAAAAMGINTTYHKVAAFVIGAFFAGVAGGLYGTYDGNVDPNSFRSRLWRSSCWGDRAVSRELSWQPSR
jgi:branched-chain amino acid transport system permease protein